MAPQEEAQPGRYDTLHEALGHAQRLGLNVSLNVHGVPIETLLELVESGVLDAIEKGAPGCGPTGRMQAGDWHTGRTELVMFIEDENEKARRLRREEDEAIEQAMSELGLNGETEEVA